MKKNILSALAICAALLGCQKNEISEPSFSGVDLHATIEDDASTRTVMDENNNIRWSEGDQIIAFMKSSYGHKYKLISSFVGKTYADFEPATSAGSNLSAGMELDHNVAYYPYSETIECQKSGSDYILNITLPYEQTYAAESFGNGYWPMAAVSEDNDITFKNVCGGLKLQLKGTADVKTIELKGNAGELLAGKASVTVYPNGTVPSIAMSSDASKSVILDCGAGVQLNEDTATEFILTVPPVAFADGFTITVTDVQNGVAILSTDKANPIKRSAILAMPVMEIQTVPVFTPTDYCISATYEITEDNKRTVLFGDGNVGGDENPIVAIDCGDGTIINNPQSTDWWYTYAKAGNYNVKYYFDSPLEKINDRGFINCPDMTSIIIPPTVKSIGNWAFSRGGSHLLKLHTVEFEGDSQLEIIGEYAFACTSLSQFTIPSKVHTIGKYAFGACHNLPIIRPGSNPRFMVWTTDGNLGLREDDGRYILVSYASGHPATEVHIHRWVFDIIEDGAISNCNNIRKIVFEDKLQYLGDIGHNCPNLEEVEGLELIGENSISGISFSSTNLKSIRIPSNIISVGGFAGNANLSEIIIEEGVGAINGDFASGSAVSEMTIPSSVTSISDGAFCGCTRLSCVTISSSVTSISSSFNNSPSIETVYVGALVPPALADSFDSVSQDAVFYVPSESLEAYKAASGWSSFSDMLVPYDFPLNYIDEYGIDHGPGVKIGETVWAPVNCGYHATDYMYGKLYQWGRKYGQGYDESDASVPEIVDGPVSLSVGQSMDNENRFYIASSPYDWCTLQEDKLWNSGSESDPVKTEYDPCPVGWRVPTHAELSELRQNHSSWTSNGYWFSGANMYTESSPKVFFPAAGEREGGYGGSAGEAMRRGRRGYYWSSRPSDVFAYYLCLDDSSIFTYDTYGRSNGYSVRCVQVTD